MCNSGSREQHSIPVSCTVCLLRLCASLRDQGSRAPSSHTSCSRPVTTVLSYVAYSHHVRYLEPMSRLLVRLVADKGDNHAVQVEEEHDEMETELDERFLLHPTPQRVSN